MLPMEHNTIILHVQYYVHIYTMQPNILSYFWSITDACMRPSFTTSLCVFCCFLPEFLKNRRKMLTLLLLFTTFNQWFGVTYKFLHIIKNRKQSVRADIQKIQYKCRNLVLYHACPCSGLYICTTLP